MAPPSTQLLVAVSERFGVIRVIGRGCFSGSVEFRSALQELRQQCRERVVLDLAQCGTMDSTFLGVIAQAAMKYAEPKNGRVTPVLEIFGANDRVTDLIDTMGVAHLLPLTSHCPLAEGEYAAAASSPASKCELARTSLEAHQALMTLNSENIAKFKDVAQFLAEEVKRMTDGTR